jgi:hypothetical protein
MEGEKPRQQQGPCAHVCGVVCIIALEPRRKENDRQRGQTHAAPIIINVPTAKREVYRYYPMQCLLRVPQRDWTGTLHTHTKTPPRALPSQKRNVEPVAVAGCST